MPEPRVLLFRLVAWFPVVYIVEEYGFTIIRITGMSMQPTFNPDSARLTRDIVLVSRISRFNNGFRRGDIVTFWHPADPSDLIVKRILALEGDIVKTLRPNPDKFVRIPTGHCWVEGDEPFHSRDSNAFGPIPIGLISGRVEAIVWPPGRAGSVSSVEIRERRVLRARTPIP